MKDFFTFYMPENIANGKEGCNSADDREKLSKGSLRNSPRKEECSHMSISRLRTYY